MVITGLQRWLTEGPAVASLPSGLRYGFLGHPASIDGSGRHALEVLGSSSAGLPDRLFAPEHGLWGHEQDMEGVSTATDPWTGLAVHSLYGATPESLRPTAESLDGLDAIVIDLQDIGARYYTYVYTMAYVMEAAASRDLPVVVLDRPNPIDGVTLEGPVLEPGWESFVGRFPLPVRHAMTSGELAQFFARYCGCACDLRIVEMQGWDRKGRFDTTGLPWVPPSPNMPALSTAIVYPGGCLIEGTQLSEGRGTTLPFELVGAPELDAVALADAMRRQDHPGVTFRAASFRPMFQKHAGVGCTGVQVIATDPDRVRSFELYLALIAECRRLLGDRFAWRTETYEFESDRLAIDLLCGNDWIRPQLESGVEVSTLRERWRPDLDAFNERRQSCLLYGSPAPTT